MYSTVVKKVFLFLSILIVVSLVACDLSVTGTPSTSPAALPTNTTIPATVAPTAIATALQPSFEGVAVTFDSLSIVLPSGLATGVGGLQFPHAEADTAGPWEVTPGHTVLKLEGYALQDKTHQPQIYVYPAQGYAELYPPAFESMHRLNNLIFDPGAAISAEQLPAVPFFNTQQVFASNIQVISFQNGQGVRFLTEYAQYPASANNHDLFYHFQGMTSDGASYIVAILPISNPFLAETSDGGAALPPEGVPYPYFADPNADMQLYYRSVIDVLNATPLEAFTPTLNLLDLLIQSMRITP